MQAVRPQLCAVRGHPHRPPQAVRCQGRKGDRGGDPHKVKGVRQGDLCDQAHRPVLLRCVPGRQLCAHTQRPAEWPEAPSPPLPEPRRRQVPRVRQKVYARSQAGHAPHVLLGRMPHRVQAPPGWQGRADIRRPRLRLRRAELNAGDRAGPCLGGLIRRGYFYNWALASRRIGQDVHMRAVRRQL